MNKRTFLAVLTAFFTLLSVNAAVAQNASIDRLNAYLSSLTTTQARFSQENADGTVITGTFYLKKPGQMRFEYDAPSDSLVIANGRTIAIYDAKSNVSPQRYPQNQTPLSLLSMQNINVTNSVFVRRIEERSGRTMVTMFDPENTQNGTMVMIFNTNPTVLREWIVRDKSGLETHVYLDNLQTGMELENRLFNIGYNKTIFDREHGRDD